MRKVTIIDSHTGGEPTRVVVSGGPELGGGTSRSAVKDSTRVRPFRSAVVNEPRGSDVVVGALLVEPLDKTCAAGVIFFNNVSYLRHVWPRHHRPGRHAGAHAKKSKPGDHKIETPVGIVTATLHRAAKFPWPTVRAGAQKRFHRGGSGHRPSDGDVAWAATGFISSKNTAWSSRWRTRTSSLIFAGASGRR